MAHKRKLDHNVVADEADRALFATFQNAANHLSQFFSVSISQQRAAFEAGKRHSLVKFQEWLSGKLQVGQMVTVADVIAYMEDQLNGGAPGGGQPERGVGSQLIGTWQGTESEAGASTSGATTQDQDSCPDVQMDEEI